MHILYMLDIKYISRLEISMHECQLGPLSIMSLIKKGNEV